MTTVDVVARPRNRFDLGELAGAFGDLGTLIPFVAGYLAVTRMDPVGVLLAFGLALIVAGAVYRTPFPVQPMKAAGAVAIAQTGAAAAVTSSVVVGAGLVTGVIWLVLGATGLARRAAEIVPRPALIGVTLGLGFSFMLEGIRMMSSSPWLAAALLVLTLVLLSRPRFPAMLILLAFGVGVALVQQPQLLSELAGISVAPRLPSLAWPALTAGDLWQGAILLALPQLPLTFGNAFIAIADENNRLFPDRPVSERRVAVSTGLLNLWSSAIGGIPMCHGAGGMAGHVRFGATTGGASIMLGVLLTATALLVGDSLGLILRLFPQSVLGIILFLAGAQLALASKEPGPDKVDRFVMLATAALAMWHVGLAVVFGFVAYHASRRGWLHL